MGGFGQFPLTVSRKRDFINKFPNFSLILLANYSFKSCRNWISGKVVAKGKVNQQTYDTIYLR